MSFFAWVVIFPLPSVGWLFRLTTGLLLLGHVDRVPDEVLRVLTLLGLFGDDVDLGPRSIFDRVRLKIFLPPKRHLVGLAEDLMPTVDLIGTERVNAERLGAGDLEDEACPRLPGQHHPVGAAGEVGQLLTSGPLHQDLLGIPHLLGRPGRSAGGIHLGRSGGSCVAFRGKRQEESNKSQVFHLERLH